jgi:hypothetical protein
MIQLGTKNIDYSIQAGFQPSGNRDRMDLSIFLLYKFCRSYGFSCTCFAMIIVVKQSRSGFVERNVEQDLRSFLCTLHFGLDGYRQLCEIFRRGLVKVLYPPKLALSKILARMFIRHVEDARFLRDGGKCRPFLAVGKREHDGFHCNERRNRSRLRLWEATVENESSHALFFFIVFCRFQKDVWFVRERI